MEKRYINTAFLYGVVAMLFGVFYREFTKACAFTGLTRLSVMHTHYFLLGMFFFLFLMLAEKSYGFSAEKNVGKLVLLYHLGLNITGVGFLLRGLTQVWGIALSRGMDAAISGISGIGHILLCSMLLLLLWKIRKKIG